MSLPTSRPRTYVNGMPLMPDDVNEIFDAVIDMKQPAHWRWESASRANVEINVSFQIAQVVSTGVGSLQGMKVSALPVGTRVTGLAARVKGNPAGTGNADVRLFYNNGDGTAIDLGGVGMVNAPPAWTTYTLDPLDTIVTMAAPGSLYLFATLDEPDMEFASFAVKVDRL